MTRRQAELLAFLTERQRAGGAMPSFDEMAAALGVRSKSAISRIIDALVDLKRVRHISGHHRSLEVVDLDVTFEPAIEDALLAYCHATGVPRGTVIRAAVREYLGAHDVSPPAGTDR